MSAKLKLTLFLLNFAKWDGVMFIKIILQGYDNLKLKAFFPGMPFLLKIILDVVEAIIGKLGNQDKILTILSIGLLLNLAMNLAANVLIHR